MGDATVQKVPQVSKFLQIKRKLWLLLTSFTGELLKHPCVPLAAFFVLISVHSLGDCPTLSEFMDSVIMGMESLWLQEFASVAYWNIPLSQSLRSPNCLQCMVTPIQSQLLISRFLLHV